MAFGYGLTWGPGSPGVPTAPGGVDRTLMPQQPVVGGPFGVNPDYPNPLATSRETVTGNIGNLGDLYKLGTGITDITNAEAASGLNANLPNYQALTTTASGDILSNLEGNVPADVWRNIQQAGAERGVATGSAGSPNANAGMLRALGLTTLDLKNLGQKQLTEAVGRTPVGKPFDPNTMLVTPGEQQAARTGQALSSSAPVPALRQRELFRASQNGLQAGMNAGTRDTTNSTDEWIAALLAGAGGKPGFSFNPPGSQGGGTPQSPFGAQYSPDAEYLRSIGDQPVTPPSTANEEDYYGDIDYSQIGGG